MCYGVSVHPIDIIFVVLLIYGWKERKKKILLRNTIEYSIGKELGIFLLYTILLCFYSLYLGCSFNNAFRFCSIIFHYAIYYIIPYIIVDRKLFELFKKYLFIFMIIGYFIYLSQNIFGWQPNSVENAASMSTVENVGGFFRTWNPFQQWLVAATCFSLSWILYARYSVRSLFIFCSLLLIVLLSFTRNVYTGLIVALLILFWQKYVLKLRKYGKSAIVMLISISIVVTLLISMFPSIMERFKLGVVELSEGEGSFRHRMNILLVTQIMVNNPLLGAGFENTGTEIDFKSIDSILLESVNSGADSHLIMLYYRFGIIGIILFAYISITFVRKNFIRIRMMGIKRESIFLIAAITYTIMIWVQAVASSTLVSEPSISINLMVWAISDCIWRFYYFEDRRKNHEKIETIKEMNGI